MGLFQWTEKSADQLQRGGVIGPDERLPWPQTGLMGIQHVIAMFGSTVLAPILMGFDPNVAVLMSGIGTLIFFLITGGKVPSYLGSSFAFIGVVIAATAYGGKGANGNIGVALGGIIACGAVYALIGCFGINRKAQRITARQKLRHFFHLRRFRLSCRHLTDIFCSLLSNHIPS